MRRRTVVLGALAILPLCGILAAGYPFAPDEPVEAPLAFHPGSDHAMAQRAGFVGPFISGLLNGAYELPLYGLSGGSVVVDDLILIEPALRDGAYVLTIGDALGPGVTRPTELSLRLWARAPAETEMRVCGVLDLLQPAGTPMEGVCRGTTHVQLVFTFPSDAEGSDRVTIVPVGT